MYCYKTHYSVLSANKCKCYVWWKALSFHLCWAYNADWLNKYIILINTFQYDFSHADEFGNVEVIIQQLVILISSFTSCIKYDTAVCTGNKSANINVCIVPHINDRASYNNASWGQNKETFLHDYSMYICTEHQHKVLANITTNAEKSFILGCKNKKQ